MKRSQELAGGNTFGVTSLPSIDAGTGDNCALTFLDATGGLYQHCHEAVRA